MGRGLISGVIWGSLFAVMSLWLIGQLGGVVALLLPPAEVVSNLPPGTGDTVIVPTGAQPAVPGRQSGPATDPSRQGSALETAPTEATPQPDTTSPGAPQTAGQAATPEGPAPDRVPGFSGQPERGTLGATAPASELASPAGDGAPNTVPQLPEQVRSPDQGVAPGSLSPPGQGTRNPQVAAAAAPDQRPQTGDGAQPAVPRADRVPVTDFSTPTVVETPRPKAVLPAPEAGPAPGNETGNAPRPPASVAPGPGVQAPGNAVTAPARDDAPTVAGSAPPQALPPVIRGGAVPVKRIGGKVANVRTNQLPTIGGAEQTAQSTPAALPDANTDAGPDASLDVPAFDPDAPAIVRFAEPFENPDQRPLMAVLLLVDPADPAALSAAAALPFPVTYVVDASQDNARALMRLLRDAGHEVVALTPLPKGANPRDVEVNFQTYLSAVPEAVAAMDVRAAEFQSGRLVATQVAQALAASGLGMITYSRGLNSASQVAEREGVPAALVFRVFDDDGRDKATIKRFLDQAAFRAGQKSGVIMVGHDRPETIQALLEWRLGSRAKTVALAPVSAALLAR